MRNDNLKVLSTNLPSKTSLKYSEIGITVITLILNINYSFACNSITLE